MPSTIKASDFNSNTTDTLRTRWTGADMACVVEALEGETVLIEVDRQTGYTLMGKLTKVIGGFHEAPRVQVVTEGNPRGINYSLWDCGNVVVLSDAGVKWKALEIQRKQISSLSRELYDALTAKVGGELRGWVRYVGLSFPGEYMAKYAPYKSDPRTEVGREQYATACVR